MKSKLPLIFIIDIDNTLIGKSYSLLNMKEFYEFVKDSCNRNKIDKNNEICKITEKLWTENINEYYFRPYIKEFFNGIKNTYPNAEFFVFSTGINIYVKKVVKLIEKHLDNKIKINKPYFSREQSFKNNNNYFVKDINVYDNLIIKTLKHKYPNIEKNIADILNERTIIIDDLEVWEEDYRHIKIKPYMFQPIMELSPIILKQIYDNDYIYNFMYNSEILQIEKGKNFHEFMFNYHLYMMNLYRQLESNNKEEIEDKEFEKLLKLILKLKNKKDNIFNKKILSNINKKMNEYKD